MTQSVYGSYLLCHSKKHGDDGQTLQIVTDASKVRPSNTPATTMSGASEQQPSKQEEKQDARSSFSATCPPRLCYPRLPTQLRYR